MRRLVVMMVALALIGGSFSTGRAGPAHLDPAYLASLDDASVAGTITPPGAEITEKRKELVAYDSLVQGYPTLTEAELTTRYFKDGRFREVTDVSRRYRPRADVEIVRDKQWGVPHVYGDTDEAMAFGAGYAAAEDRLPIMELLRALGRAEAFQLLGTAPAWLADAEMIRLYGYTEREFQAMIDRVPRVYGQTGQDLVDLVDAHVAGINAFVLDVTQGRVPKPVGLADLGIAVPAPWKPTDVVAVVSTVRALFGAGGGGELSNASRWLALLDTLGPQKARAVWEDFRNRDNLDGLNHTTTPFPYMPRVETDIDPRANVVGFTTGDNGVEGALGELRGQIDALAQQARPRYERLVLDTKAGRIDLSRPGSASNFLIADATLSATGHPILLGGPQAGYFDPQILVENELHGDTIHSRGAGFPGLSTLAIIGRSHQAAWSATAGGSDMIDTYVEVLCEPDGSEPTEESHHYRFDGRCLAMQQRGVRRVADLVPASVRGRNLLPDIVAERTVHGSVVARGRIGDRAVAVSSKRTTYGKELDPGVSILRMNRGEARTAADFIRIYQESHNLSTNWGYVNDHEIAYVHGGLYPIRPTSVDPDMPVWGTGEWEWARNPDGTDRYLPVHPNEANSPRHYIVSWNNHQAPGWSNADNNWGHSSLYRADLLEDQLQRAAPHSVTPVRLVQMMERAGLTDLRGSHVLPELLRVLDATPPPGKRELQMRQILGKWVEAGALRRDGDLDGHYDDGTAVAIMDAWWNRLIGAIYLPVLGSMLAQVNVVGFHNAPGSVGSAFQDGFYGQVHTDMAMLLGAPLDSPTSQIYCGSNAVGVNGSLAACSARLWASLRDAGDALGGLDPFVWDADADGERIMFLPDPLLSMQWVNRPTTQVLAMFGKHAAPAAAVSDGERELPATR